MIGNHPKDRLFNFFYGLDIAVNGALGGRPFETLSGSIGRSAEAGDRWALVVAEPLVNLCAHPWQRNHCRTCAAEEQTRRTLWDQYVASITNVPVAS